MNHRIRTLAFWLVTAATGLASGLALAQQQTTGVPGSTWVRVRFLPSSAYAENEFEVNTDELPTFVTVLQAHWPAGDALAEQVRQVTQAVAACLSVPPERVHVQYAPEAAGRQAFGGNLVG